MFVQTYRTLVSNFTARARDRPRFKPHVFPEFWQKWNFIFHKKRKSAKTHGSCKHIAHWCQILQHEPGTDLDLQIKKKLQVQIKHNQHELDRLGKLQKVLR